MITLEGLLAEIAEIEASAQSDRRGHSRQELQALWGCSERKTMAYLRLLIAAGKVTCDPNGKRPGIDGRLHHTPVYVFKKGMFESVRKHHPGSRPNRRSRPQS